MEHLVLFPAVRHFLQIEALSPILPILPDNSPVFPQALPFTKILHNPTPHNLYEELSTLSTELSTMAQLLYFQLFRGFLEELSSTENGVIPCHYTPVYFT